MKIPLKTYANADTLAEATGNDPTMVSGGGDSAWAINNAGVTDKVSHVATGGGVGFWEGV